LFAFFLIFPLAFIFFAFIAHPIALSFQKIICQLDSVHPEIGKFGRDQGAQKILPQAYD
jgi:hypothetical protein